MMDKKAREEVIEFTPQFDQSGLIPCITIHHGTGSVLMMAYMNQDALDATLQSGEVHYWSRSRQELWHKGASSGAVQQLIKIRVDCDQDCLLLSVDVDEKALDQTCHTNRKTCFYRTVANDGKTLIFADD